MDFNKNQRDALDEEKHKTEVSDLKLLMDLTDDLDEKAKYRGELRRRLQNKLGFLSPPSHSNLPNSAVKSSQRSVSTMGDSLGEYRWNEMAYNDADGENLLIDDIDNDNVITAAVDDIDNDNVITTGNDAASHGPGGKDIISHWTYQY